MCGSNFLDCLNIPSPIRKEAMTMFRSARFNRPEPSIPQGVVPLTHITGERPPRQFRSRVEQGRRISVE